MKTTGGESRRRAPRLARAAAAIAVAAGAVVALRLAFEPAGRLGALPGGTRPGELNLVVLSLDTTRADRLGCYGYQDVSTPHLDALARGGTLFEQAHSPAPLTLPSHTSLFTGRYPPAHGVRDNGGFFVQDEEVTLAERLEAAGWKTAGFVSAYVLDRRWGISQGFGHYFDDFDLARYKTVSMGDIQRRGDETLERAITWVREQRAGRFFAWVHLYDPHTPYDPPEPYASAYPGRPYVGEIAFTDSLVGQLVAELSGMGLLDRTLIVVVGDHGESLGEHNESGHAFFVYSVSTRVPFLLSGPWPGLAGRRIPRPVSLVDVAPTILELLGLPAQQGAHGRSLVPLLSGGSLPDRPVYSESFYPRYHFGWSDLRTLIVAGHRLIEAPRPELYDLAADPAELDNLAGRQPDRLERMRASLADLEGSMGQPAESVAPEEMDEETRRRLAALGYIGSTVDTSGKASGDLPDPKDKIDVVNRMHAAREDFLSGRLQQAIGALRSVIQDAPEVIDAYFRLGNAYVQAGDLPAAQEMFRRTLALKPDHDWAVVMLADTFVQMGRIDDALAGYRRFLQRDPANETVAYRLAETLLDAGRLAEAESAFSRVLQIQPQRASAAVGLGAVSLRRGDPGSATRWLRQALSIDAGVRNAHYNLALAAEARGDAAGAIQAYRAELAIHPHATKARFNLARLLRQQKDLQGQIRELTAAVTDRPDFTLGRFFLAKALLDAGDLAGAESHARMALEDDPGHYYAPLAHYVLADLYARQGRAAQAQAEAAEGRRLEGRGLAPPSE